MAPDAQGLALVIMGVSGAGKPTIGEMLAKAVNCSFVDADDFHPQSNKGKLQKGIALSDEDRIPWLKTLRDVLRTSLMSGKYVVLGFNNLGSEFQKKKSLFDKL